MEQHECKHFLWNEVADNEVFINKLLKKNDHLVDFQS